METFARISEIAEQHFRVAHRDKFVLGLEIETSPGRHQSVFLAELHDDDDRRYLRVETAIAPLAQHDPVKLLRVNLTLRIGYLAVGDLESVSFIKLCDNIGYRYLSEPLLIEHVRRIASVGDQIEQVLLHGGDWF